jgi:hypothetical protein
LFWFCIVETPFLVENQSLPGPIASRCPDGPQWGPAGFSRVFYPLPRKICRLISAGDFVVKN